MLKDRNCGGNLQYGVYVSWGDCIKLTQINFLLAADSENLSDN